MDTKSASIYFTTVASHNNHTGKWVLLSCFTDEELKIQKFQTLEPRLNLWTFIFSKLNLWNNFRLIKKVAEREFPGSPVVRTWSFHCHGPSSVQGRGTNIPQAVCHFPPPTKVVEFSCTLHPASPNVNILHRGFSVKPLTFESKSHCLQCHASYWYS